MKNFMLDIQLEGLDTETRMKLLPREQELVKVLEQNGTIVDTFIKLDMSGIFIVMMAADAELKNSHDRYVATLAVTNRSSSRNLLFNQNDLLTGWKNNTTLEEKWVAAETNGINDSSKIIPKAFSGIQIIHAPFYTALQLSGKFSLIDAYLQIAATNPIGYYDHSDSILMDVGKPENLEKAATLFP